MTLPGLFSQLDANALTISIGFFCGWAGIHFSLFEAVGDLAEIRKRAICKLAEGHTETEIIRFIEGLYRESKVLVLEPKKKSRALRNFLLLFAASSIFAIFSKPLAVWLPFLPSDEFFYSSYLITLGASSVLLWYEVQYFREFRRLEKKFPPRPSQSEHTHVITMQVESNESVKPTRNNAGLSLRENRDSDR